MGFQTYDNHGVVESTTSSARYIRAFFVSHRPGASASGLDISTTNYSSGGTTVEPGDWRDYKSFSSTSTGRFVFQPGLYQLPEINFSSGGRLTAPATARLECYGDIDWGTSGTLNLTAYETTLILAGTSDQNITVGAANPLNFSAEKTREPSRSHQATMR